MEIFLRNIFVLIVICTLSSCSSLPLTNPFFSQNIVGCWETHDDNDDDYVVFQFNKDGSALSIIYDESESLSYSIKGNTITFLQNAREFSGLYRRIGRRKLELLIDDSDEYLLFSCKKNIHFPSVVSGFERHLIDIKSIHLDLRIDGDQAHTSVMHEVYNGSQNELEAHLELPIPSDAKVTAYALDIKGELVEGVATLKEDARHSFETIERKRIDPGLLEVSEGNVFTTEIYPVMPQESRYVRLEYIQTLKPNSHGEYEYDYPFSKYLNDTQVTISISRNRRAPLKFKNFPNKGKKPYKLFTHNKKWKAHFPGRDSYQKSPLNDFRFSFKQEDIGRAVLQKANDGNYYFYKREKYNKNDLVPTDVPEEITILWDVSSSMEDNHEVYNRILNRLYKNYYKKGVKNLNVVTFSNKILSSRKFNLRNLTMADLSKLSNNIRYDGATNFKHVLSSVEKEINGFYLLFSDGVHSLGSYDLDDVDLSGTTSIYPITPEVHHNISFLEYLADQTGGFVFELGKSSADDVVDLIGAYLPVDNIGTPSLYMEHIKHNYVIGNSLYVEHVARVNSEINNKQNDVSIQLGEDSYKFSKNSIINSEISKIRFLSLTLSRLLSNPSKNKNQIITLGLENNFVTPYTSMIVYEDIEDYMYFNVKPPSNHPDYNKYLILIEEESLRSVDVEKDEQHFLSNILKNWNRRINWWHNIYTSKQYNYSFSTGLYRPSKRSMPSRLDGYETDGANIEGEILKIQKNTIH